MSGMLNTAKATMEQADYVIAGLVEIQRAAQRPASPGEIREVIGGTATMPQIRERMRKLERLGVIERVLEESGQLARTDLDNYIGYQLTILGEALLREELANWQPDEPERLRREAELLAAARSAAL